MASQTTLSRGLQGAAERTDLDRADFARILGTNARTVTRWLVHAPANTPGIRHVAFAVDDIDAVVVSLRARGAELVGEMERYEDSYRLCYVRDPEGIIVELAEQIS